jgi:hypothetical protein
VIVSKTKLHPKKETNKFPNKDWEDINPPPKTPEEEEVIFINYNPLPKDDQEAPPKLDWIIRLEERGEGSKQLN